MRLVKQGTFCIGSGESGCRFERIYRLYRGFQVCGERGELCVCVCVCVCQWLAFVRLSVSVRGVFRLTRACGKGRGVSVWCVDNQDLEHKHGDGRWRRASALPWSREPSDNQRGCVCAYFM